MTLPPASQTKLKALIANLQTAQNRVNEFLMDTADALGIDPAQSEFSLQTMSFVPKALPAEATTATTATPAAPDLPTSGA